MDRPPTCIDAAEQRLGSFSMVEVEHTTEPLATLHPSITPACAAPALCSSWNLVLAESCRLVNRTGWLAVQFAALSSSPNMRDATFEEWHEKAKLKITSW